MQTFEDMLDEWLGVTEQIKELKRRELSLRNALDTGGFPNPKVGTNKLTLADGRIFRSVHKDNFYINSTDQKELLPLLKELNIPPETVVDTPLVFSGRKYKEAPEEIRNLLDAHITVTRAAPKIDVV